MQTITQPSLTTQRLTLRPFAPEDAEAVQLLAGDRAIADTTERIPHPYEDGMAREWIASRRQHFQEQRECACAVVLQETSQLIGCVSLTLNMANARAELGYWIGRRFWNHGYSTEAARAIIEFGFTTLGLRRFHSSHLSRNPASGRVLEKLGMREEGLLRQHSRKWEVFEDLVVYGILRDDWSHGDGAS